MKAFISNKYHTMEALESEVELFLTENTIFIRFQYQPTNNEVLAPWRTIGVNANQLLNAVQSVVGKPGVKYEVIVQSDSYNTYPNDVLKISFSKAVQICFRLSRYLLFRKRRGYRSI